MSAHTFGRRSPAPPAGPRVRDTLRVAGRTGFTARGVLYFLVGYLALRIAFGDGGNEADRQGALHQIGRQPLGTALLWLLTAGLAGMALWRGAQAVLGGRTGSGHGGQGSQDGQEGAGKRLAAGARAVFYAVVCWGTATYAAGAGSSGGSGGSGAAGGSGGSSDETSKDMTATLLKLPAGRWLVAAAGAALCVAGAVIAVRALRRAFLKKLETGRMGRRTRTAVTASGVAGGTARGGVYAGAGAFAVVAAIRFDPHQAKGMDDTLRSFAHTPAGPWLLVAVAVGLILFGLFSFASARWRRL
ncbi:DUF1206 domain-containing protein [Streptomyces sp. PRB2-1]|uniref:DUF1206 domain-containing protein n=1 Tax=Actinacidiphila epipremni TaxID=2053013 RepID=A0ABX0ZP29_9ACTN|nr:DUF1206 domain-containing protein [Actinacidiphila epipremni]